jgi:hypothetical protein
VKNNQNQFNKPMRKLNFMMQAMAVLVLSAGVFTGCRKGEDDPWLTLRSRKARLTGKWNITSGKVSKGQMYMAPNSQMISGTFDEIYSGSVVQQINRFSWNGMDSVRDVQGTFEGTVEIFRDGTYKMNMVKRVAVTATDTTKITSGAYTEGYWTLTGGTNDTRKREQLMLQEVKNAPIGGVATVNDNPVPSALYNIRQLKHKEIVVEYENNSNDAANYVKMEWTWSLKD